MFGVNEIILFTGVLLINNAETQTSIRPKNSHITCSKNTDCNENFYCYVNKDTSISKCKCNSGFKLARYNTTFSECLSELKLGEPCENTAQCQFSIFLSICNESKICQCNFESHNYNEKCYNIATLGELCMSDANCYLENAQKNGTIGRCVDSRCECNEGQTPSKNKRSCLRVRKLGEDCISDEECLLSLPNSVCQEICKCNQGYTQSRNGTTCQKVATKFGDPCESDAQCDTRLQQSVCNNGTCGCGPKFYESGDSGCMPLKQLGDSCEADSQCGVLKSKCRKGTCECPSGRNQDGACNISPKTINNNNNAATRQTSLILFNTLFILLLKLYYTC